MTALKPAPIRGRSPYRSPVLALVGFLPAFLGMGLTQAAFDRSWRDAAVYAAITFGFVALVGLYCLAVLIYGEWRAERRAAR